MTPFPLSRRRFLALSGGAALLAACGSSGSGKGSSKSSSDPTFTELAPGVVSMDLFAHPEPQRFAFVVVAKEGYASGELARVALAAPGAEPTTFVPTVARAKGLDYDGNETPFVFQVKAKADSIAAGDPAPRAASPTTSEPMGVDPICTRDPVCPLHSVSLDSITGKGRPIAVMFGTPARCQTRYCGPVLDTMLPMVETYSDRIDFVHVEIYKNNETTDVVPTLTEWRLGGEPWLFGIDGEGIVTARLDGAFDQSEIRALLDGLTTRA